MRLAGGSMRRFRPALAAVRSAEVCAAAAAAAAAGRRCISQRAGRALGLLPSYLADARSAPASCLNLSVAENQMLADLLTPRLAAAGGSFPDELIYYQPTPGRADMREAVARYMSSSLYAGRHCVNPEQLIIGAGCNAVLENLFFTIAEPGSAVLVPAPYYAAFDFDLSSRAGMAVVPVVPEGLAAAGSSGSGFMEPATYYPTAAGLDAAYEAAEAAGTPPAALLPRPQCPPEAAHRRPSSPHSAAAAYDCTQRLPAAPHDRTDSRGLLQSVSHRETVPSNTASGIL